MNPDKAPTAFLYRGQAKSVRAKHRGYDERLRAAAQRYLPSAQPAQGLLYGSVYYFHRTQCTLDADNMSKPIWDALRGLLFRDDRLIALCHAGIVDLRHAQVSEIDLTRIPDSVAPEFIEAIGQEEHLVYIELGPLEYRMFTFGP